MADIIVWIQPIGDIWQQLGTGRDPGVIPESVEASSNSYGFDNASFTLKRDPLAPQVDLSSFTPVEIYDAGTLIFEGFIWETPGKSGTDQAITVNCRGWQYELDDDLFGKNWLHTDMTVWQDCRTFLDCDLTRFTANGQVEVGDGAIILGQPNQSPYIAGEAQGVTLDMGEPGHFYRLIMEYDSTNLAGNPVFQVYARAHNSHLTVAQGLAGTYNDLIVGLAPSAGRVVSSGLPVGDYRYLTIFLFWTTGPGTTGNDHQLRLKKLTVAGADGYEASGRTYLRSSQVIDETFQRAVRHVTAKESSPAFTDEVASLAPVRWYRFSTGGVSANASTDIGGVADTSVPAGNVLPVNDVGGPLLYEQSYHATFNGTSSALKFARPVQDDFAIFVFFKTTQSAATGVQPWAMPQLVSGENAPGADDFHLGIANGVVRGGVGDVPVNDSVATNDGQWHSACLRRKGMYAVEWGIIVDGLREVAGSLGGSGGYAGSLGGAPELYIGRLATSPAQQFFAGDIAELVILDVYPSFSTIRRLHEAAMRKVQDGTAERTFLNLPSARVDAMQPKTPRELVDGLNTLHRYQTKVVPGPKLKFARHPSSPKFESGAWSSANFDDASLNSGEEIYNRVVATATDAAGKTIKVERYAAGLPEAIATPTSDWTFGRDISLGLSNRDFENNVTGWNGGTGTLTRDTTRFRTGVASARVTGGTIQIGTDIYGTIVGDRFYRLSFWVLPEGITAGSTQTVTANVRILGKNQEIPLRAIFGWQSVTVIVLVNTDAAYSGTNDLIKIGPMMVNGANQNFNMDDVALDLVIGSPLDTLGRLRTKNLQASAPMTPEIMEALSLAFLRTHRQAPLKGGGNFAPGDLRGYVDGHPVHPRHLLTEVNELIHHSHAYDPITGQQGRDAAVASVNYNPETEQAQVALDNERDNFEVLMQRYAVVSGNAQAL